MFGEIVLYKDVASGWKIFFSTLLKKQFSFQLTVFLLMLEFLSEIVPEVSEDWNEWGEWAPDAEGWFVRKRVCKNPDSNCRGRSKERRRRRSWRIDKEFAFTTDGSKGCKNIYFVENIRHLIINFMLRQVQLKVQLKNMYISILKIKAGT